MAKKRKKFKRRHSTQNIKSMPYYLKELADVMDVSYGTVLRWVNEGMKVFANQYPLMTHGDYVKAFHKEKNRPNKLAPNEFHCCKCQAPRKAQGNFAYIDYLNPKSPNLKAVCETCSTRLNKKISMKNMPEIEETFEIITEHPERLLASKDTSTNDITEEVLING